MVAKAVDPRDVRGVSAGEPIRGPWLTGAAKGLDDERRKPPAMPRVPGLRGFFATITTAVGDGKYEFEERHLPEWNAGTSELDWLTPETGSGKRTGDCYELNGNAELAVDDEVFLLNVRGKDGKEFYVFWHPPEGGGGGFIKITTATAPIKGDLKRDGTAMSSWDTKSGAHYSVTDEGNGCVAVNDVFRAGEDSSGAWHIAPIHARFKDTS